MAVVAGAKTSPPGFSGIISLPHMGTFVTTFCLVKDFIALMLVLIASLWRIRLRWLWCCTISGSLLDWHTHTHTVEETNFSCFLTIFTACGQRWRLEYKLTSKFWPMTANVNVVTNTINWWLFVKATKIDLVYQKMKILHHWNEDSAVAVVLFIPWYPSYLTI